MSTEHDDRDVAERVRRSLARRAEQVSSRPAPEELTDRIVRRERRKTRTLSLALLLALFAGPTLGFVAARGDDGVDRAEPADVEDEAGAGDVVVEDAGPLPKLATEGALGGGGDLAPRAAPGVATEGVDASHFTAYPGGWYGDQPLARVFTRDAGAATVRVFRAAMDSPTTAGPPWWDPPAWCFPTGYVQADVSTDAMVGIASGNVFAERREGPVGGALGVVGVAEQDPYWVLVAQSTVEAATIRATFEGGGADEMAPVDGVAVLVAPTHGAATDTADVRANVEALDGSGAVVGTAAVRLGWYEEVGSEECYGPQELPAPGQEQPADPEAARADIAGHFGRTFDEVSMEERLAGIEDPTGVEEIWEQLITGPFQEQVRGARSTLGDIVFLSATRAAVQYSLDVPGYGANAFGARFQEFVLVDGDWKVTRESFCRDISLTGVPC